MAGLGAAGTARGSRADLKAPDVELVNQRFAFDPEEAEAEDEWALVGVLVYTPIREVAKLIQDDGS